MKKIIILFCLFFFVTIKLPADDFFEIHEVRYHHTDPSDETAMYPLVRGVDKNNNFTTKIIFSPYLEVRLKVKQPIKLGSVFEHVYFYDQNEKLLATITDPSAVYYGNSSKVELPRILPKDKDQTIGFLIPDQVLKQEEWSALVVFGDSKGVDAHLYPGGEELSAYDYPEKNILEDKNGPPIERKPTLDPIIEHVVQTNNPAQPQITLFLRPPLGMTNTSEAKGVLCMSLLAGSLDEVKRQLQGFEVGDDLGGILKFAEDHKLIIICWGSRGLWNPHKSWDDLNPDTARATDKAIDQVAHAWENGVQYFVKEYGIPSNGYLLWGIAGSAQYACRLALRKPEYFLAVHVHVPSSFDKPTPAANKILWCLTTGELESGYRRSLGFYTQCRALGYPMIYKAIVGLGHSGSPISDEIGLKFFDYALSVRDQRVAYDASLNNPLTQFQMAQTSSELVQPWIESFRRPAFMGDVVNQEVFSYDQKDMVPVGFRTPLPTKEIADAWNK